MDLFGAIYIEQLIYVVARAPDVDMFYEVIMMCSECELSIKGSVLFYKSSDSKAGRKMHETKLYSNKNEMLICLFVTL